MKNTRIMHLLPVVSSVASMLNIVLYIVDRNAGEEGQGNTIASIVGLSWLFATVLVACSVVFLIVKAAVYPKAKVDRKVVILNVTSVVLYCLFFAFGWIYPPAFRGV